MVTNDCGTALLMWSTSIDGARGSDLIGYNISRDGTFMTGVLAPVISSLQDGMSPATTHSLGVSAVDKAGNESAQAFKAATALSCPNMRPVANAGPNQTNLLGVATSFDG